MSRLPTYTKTFDSNIDADAWVTSLAESDGTVHSVWKTSHTGQTVVTVEGEYALRALDKERPLAPGGFRIRDLESVG